MAQQLGITPHRIAPATAKDRPRYWMHGWSTLARVRSLSGVHSTPDSMVPLGRFGRQVQQFDPVEVVLKCAATSRFMDKENKTLHQEPFSDTLAGFRRTHYALVTHSGLASVVRLAIRN